MTTYTQQQREAIAALWNAGQLSASDIANAINARYGLSISRNAVISLTKRMKLPHRSSSGKWQMSGTAKRLAAMQAKGVVPGRKPKPPVLDVPMPSAAIGKPGEFAGCRWPVNKDGEEFRCCGNHEKPGRPYCPAHCHIAYTPKHKQMQGTSRCDRQFR